MRISILKDFFRTKASWTQERRLKQTTSKHIKVESHVKDVAFRTRKVRPAIIMIQTVLRPLRYCKNDSRKTKRVLDEAGRTRVESATPISREGSRSPEDATLDGVSLGSCVDRALDTGHGRIPRLVNMSWLELDLDYLPTLQSQKTLIRKRHVDRKRKAGDARRSQCVNQ